jgi:AcrR family transcriptional regulator
MARPRAADFDEHRDAILAMAARLFADRGYAAGSIADLASACGVSKALLYHYYRDKEQLLFDIADRYVDSLQVIVDEVAAEALPAQPHLRRLIERFMQAYEHAGAYHRVLVQDVKYLSPPHRRRVVAKQKRVVDAFASAIGAVAPKLAGAPLLKPVTMTLFGMINWTFTWLKDAGPLSYAQMAPVVTELFLNGVGALAVPSRPNARSPQAAGRGGQGRRSPTPVSTGAPPARPRPARRIALPPPPVPDHMPARSARRKLAKESP